ncbi:MAG: ribonuclease E/G [Thermodesulfobacteriota bacterium]|nr:ribonuclease E/G [Thermodesulfobacteriota bacterium]
MKKMLINAAHPEEIRIAVVSDNLLQELYIESSLKEMIRGNVYRGKITKVEQSLNAVFVDFGREKNGFLPIHDINPAFIKGAQGKKGITQHLHKGLDVPVQVSREETGAKGALLTMNISIPGRYMVLLPMHDLAGVSKKIEDDEQRKRLKDIMKQLNPPADMGLIVRTAGMGKTKAELSKDMNYLLRLWKTIDKDFKASDKPSLIYREGDIITRSIRDYFTTDTSEILIDDEETCKKTIAFMKKVMPRHTRVIKQYREKRPLFTKYELERQINDIYSNKVRLKSGGNIVIEQTEAMVVVDVNSARATNHKDIENTALSTNLEAAEEIARQLTLRDLGGLVVVDFIDMRPRENNRKVEREIKKRLKPDRAHLVLGRISQFGIMELSRQRLSPPLLEKSHIVCPYCEGTGILRSVESSALMALRQIQQFVNKKQDAAIRVDLPDDVAIYLMNHHKGHLVHIENTSACQIDIQVDNRIKRGETRVELMEKE